MWTPIRYQPYLGLGASYSLDLRDVGGYNFVRFEFRNSLARPFRLSSFDMDVLLE